LSICTSCLNKKFGLEEFPLQEWRWSIARAIEKCDVVVYQSNATRDIVRRIFKPKREEIIPHGLEVSNPNNSSVSHQELTTNGKFSVGFIGYMAIHKGSEFIKKAIPLLLNNQIDVHFFGPVDSSFVKKSKKRGARVFYHGKYNSTKELTEKIRSSGVKVIGLLSVTPETFSNVLSEAWNAGIPVVTSPYGALKERVEKTNGGIILSELSVEKFLEEILNLSVSQQKYKSLVQNVTMIKTITINDMAEQYLQLYQSLIDSKKEIKISSTINQVLQNMLEISFIILKKEGLNLLFGSMDELRKSSPKTKEGYPMLSKNEWQMIHTLFPNTNRQSKMMKRYTVLSLYLRKFGIRTTIKRILSLIKI